jgi:hypothetical protein
MILPLIWLAPTHHRIDPMLCLLALSQIIPARRHDNTKGKWLVAHEWGIGAIRRLASGSS